MTEEADAVTVRSADRPAWQIAAKRAVQLVFLVFAAPAFLGYWAGRLIWSRDRAFLGTSEYLACIPGMFGVYVRQAFYRYSLARCGRDCHFGWLSTISLPQTEIGDEVYIGRRCSVGFATLDSGCMLADGVQVLSGGREHGLSTDGSEHRRQSQKFVRMFIGRGAWIGTNAVVMADVGASAVVGAGAVVTKEIPYAAVAVGVPARVVRHLQSS